MKGSYSGNNSVSSLSGDDFLGVLQQGRGVADTKEERRRMAVATEPSARLGGKASKQGNGTMSESPESGNGKARKRPAAKAATRQSAVKVKATFHLSVEASQRLTVHAAMMGMDRSELVEQLISLHLRRFVVSDRGGAGEDVAA
jgi:hypothetical protein